MLSYWQIGPVDGMEKEKEAPQVVQFNNLVAPVTITLSLLVLTIAASSLEGREGHGLLGVAAVAVVQAGQATARPNREAQHQNPHQHPDVLLPTPSNKSTHSSSNLQTFPRPVSQQCGQRDILFGQGHDGDSPDDVAISEDHGQRPFSTSGCA